VLGRSSLALDRIVYHPRTVCVISVIAGIVGLLSFSTDSGWAKSHLAEDAGSLLDRLIAEKPNPFAFG
jgi:hypothetical protein